jgi:hypothetical protein
MPATLDTPVCRALPKPAPAPERCWRCKGAGADPEKAGAGRERCAGGGWEFARFDLAPSRSHELRRVRFEAGRDGLHTLRVWMLKRKSGWKVWPAEETYTVVETANDWGGRSFLVHKVGTGRSHNVFIGRGSSCECEGNTFLSAAKANQAAYEAGEEVFPTVGCRHADALSALIGAGWLDLPEPTERVP